MPEEWPGQAELHSRLKKLDSISSSKIAVIAKFAVKSVKYYKFVVHAIEHHMKHGDDKAHLQGMCIIDAILRSANEEIPRDKNPYPSRFSKNMGFTLGLAAACTDVDRGKIVRIVKIWISAKLLPESARRTINDWLQKNDSGAAETVGEPTSRLLSSIEKLKEAPPSLAQPAPSPPEELDTFDYGDEDDDEARLASQARRLEEQSRKLEAEKEAAANAARNDNRTTATDFGPSTVKVPVSEPNDSDLHRFGFVRHSDQSNVPAGMVRVLSCVLYLGGLPAGFQEEQLRAQIGSFGKIDDIRIVSGPVVNSAFVRYIDREEAESAKNLVRSYFSEYKVGWGKGVGVNKDDFDTRQGIGMVPEASLVRTQKPTIAARPQVALEPHPPHPTPVRPAAHGSVSSPVRPWHNAQQQTSSQPAASWNGMAPPSSMQPAQAMPPYSHASVPTPPRSISAVPASWDGGANASIPSWDMKASGVPPRSGWDAVPAPSNLSNSSKPMESGWGSQSQVPPPGGAWGGPNPNATAPLSSSWDEGRSQGPSWDSKNRGSLPAPPSSDFHANPRNRSEHGADSSWDSKPTLRGPSSSSSWDKKKNTLSYDQGPPSHDQRSSSSWDKTPSGSWNKGPSMDPPLGRQGAGGGSWENNPSSGSSWGDISSSARGNNNPSSGLSWGDNSSFGPARNDTAPSGRGNNPLSGPSWGARNNPGRENNNQSSGSSWGDNSSSWGAPKDDRQDRGNGKFGSGTPRGGGRRFNDRDRDRSESDNPRPWNNRDDNHDNKDFDSRRGPPRNKDNNFRGPPRNDRDGGNRAPRNNNGNDFRGSRINGPRGRDNCDSGSSWGNGTSWGGPANNSQSDTGSWGQSAGNSQSATNGSQASASWGDQPSSGTTWDNAPSSGVSWVDTNLSGKDAASSSGLHDSSLKSSDDNGSTKRSCDEGGWGSLPADYNGNNKRIRNDGW